MSTATAPAPSFPKRAPFVPKLRLGGEFKDHKAGERPCLFVTMKVADAFAMGLLVFDFGNDVVSLGAKFHDWSDLHAKFDTDSDKLDLPVPLHATFGELVAFIDDPETRPAVLALSAARFKEEFWPAFEKLKAVHSRHFRGLMGGIFTV